MRQYLLDTNVLGAYLQGRSGALSLARSWILNDEASTSIVVYGELTEYLKGFVEFPRHQAALRTLLKKVHPYPLTYSLLEQYADLRRALRPPFGPGLIGDIDTLIVRRDTRTYIPQQLGKNLKGGSWATHLTWS